MPFTECAAHTFHIEAKRQKNKNVIIQSFSFQTADGSNETPKFDKSGVEVKSLGNFKILRRSLVRARRRGFSSSPSSSFDASDRTPLQNQSPEEIRSSEKFKVHIELKLSYLS